MTTTTSQEANTAKAEIARAVQSGSFSAEVLKGMVARFGLSTTQKAVVGAIHDAEESAGALRHCMGFLFSDDYAKEIGAWPRPTGYGEE